MSNYYNQKDPLLDINSSTIQPNKSQSENVLSKLENIEQNLTKEENCKDYPDTWVDPSFQTIIRKSLDAKGSLISGVVSLASINFDTTSLCFPFAIYYTGLIPGTLMFITIAFLSCWTTKLLFISGVKHKIYSYPKLIKFCLGKKMRIFFHINNIIFCIGPVCQYILTISLFFSELMLVLFKIEIGKMSKAIQMCLCMIFIQIPLTSLVNISKLKYVSMATCFVLCFALLLILVQSPFFYKLGIEEGRSFYYFRSINWSYLDSFSIFLFAFVPHTGLFLVINELERHDIQKCNKLISRTSLLTFSLFSIIGYSGFFSLIKDVPAIFISRKDLGHQFSDTLMIIVKILFFISLNFTCSINFHFAKKSLHSLFSKEKNTTNVKNFLMICVFYISCNFLAFLFEDVIQIIGIVSGICVTFTSYVLPILCYVKSNELEIWHFKNLITITILIIITTLGYTSAFKNLYNVIF